MQVTKTKDTSTFFNADRELKVEGGKYIYKGIDITSITKPQGSDFLSVMGSAGGKQFHNYFGLDNGRWYRFTGVTSALDYVGDKSNLMQWYANQVVEQFGWSKQKEGENAAEYKERLDFDMFQKMHDFNALPTPDKVEFVKKARTAATQYARKTANLGKTVHADIEAYIKDSIANNEGKARVTFLASTDVSREQVKHFVEWALKNNVVFRASEFQVHSKKYWYAGTLDIVLEINGDLYVGDIKTTNSIYGRGYFAQVSAYRMALEEMYPDRYKFSGSILIRIGRDGKFDSENDVHFSNYYEDDKAYFLAGLTVYRQENNMFSK